MQLFPDPPARLHFIGIKGQAMTALAQILQHQGYVITGSDVAEVFPTDAVLERLHIPVVDHFGAENISAEVEGVIYSTAYDADHIERKRAVELALPVWSYPEAVSLLFEIHRNSIAIAGSHGKTTTTSLIGHMLETAGKDPTVIVGSVDKGWSANARAGASEWFVFEADEYQNKFQYYAPRYLLVTNVDYDHPDFFPDRASYEKTFFEFVAKIPADGLVVLCADNAPCLALQTATQARTITYGQSDIADWLLSQVVVSPTQTSFAVTHGSEMHHYTIPFAGEHYALNAAGAIALLKTLSIDDESIEKAIRQFHGTSRRMEHKGEYHGAIIVDDFAHHPTEITATLKALRSEYPTRRLNVVFHPHTFTRTLALFDHFVEALKLADHIYLLPIYGSAREAQGGISSDDIVRRLEAEGARAENLSSIADAITLLKARLQKDDVLVTMGAGDVWQAAEGLLV